MGELKILNQNRTNFVQGIQDPEDYKMFYFLMRPDDEPYKGGLYIGQIQISDEYPTKAPVFKMLTPSGRFEIDKAICLTNSHYHPEHSTAAWNINSMIIAFISIFIADDTTGISHIKDTKENRKRMALESYNYNRNKYPRVFKLFDQFVNEDFSLKSEEDINKILEMYKPKPKKGKDDENKLKEEAERKAKEEAEQQISKLEELTENVAEAAAVGKPKKRVVKKKVNEENKEEVKPPEETKPVKKVTKRVVKKKEPEEVKEPEEIKPVKKVVKRIVKKKEVSEEAAQPIEVKETEETKPVKKVIKKVVKRVVKKKEENENDNE